MSKPFAVVFAGVPGSSKSIIAFALSGTFGLPIYNNDSVRFEVREDMLVDDINIPKVLDEFNKRSIKRQTELLARGRSVILDASVDRKWTEQKQRIEKANYDWFMVDMELSKAFLKRLYLKTGRPTAVEELDDYWQQHIDFMKQYKADVDLEITDKLFKDRIAVSIKALQEYIDKR